MRANELLNRTSNLRNDQRNEPHVRIVTVNSILVCNLNLAAVARTEILKFYPITIQCRDTTPALPQDRLPLGNSCLARSQGYPVEPVPATNTTNTAAYLKLNDSRQLSTNRRVPRQEFLTHVAPAINISVVLALVHVDRAAMKVVDASTMTIMRDPRWLRALTIMIGMQRSVTTRRAMINRLSFWSMAPR